MTGGERRFAQRLIEKLEEDYLCWYDVPIGRLSLHPDFVVLNPRRGLLIIEVKDWKPDTIHAADRASFTILTDKGHKVVPNPLEQGRQYAQSVADMLGKDPALTIQEEGRYQNRLSFPYGYGVALPNISRKVFDSAGLGNVIEASRVICQDEMLDAVDAEVFQTFLWNMFTVQFKTLMTLPQIDRVRWHLFPEIRIQPGQLELIPNPDDSQEIADSLPELIRVMDMQQEQLARSLGDGHRVIHGVAGSGKTLILCYRCERLAPLLTKPVLVLCYNAALSAKLLYGIKEKGLSNKVNVRTFHAWCLDQLRLYNVALPPRDERFYDAVVTTIIHAVEKGMIPRAQYGAVMIDEGHDFRPEWLKLVTQMVDPDTNSLLVLFDDAQSIYDAKNTRKFSFSSVGIQAQGRTTVLRLNYRNTMEVLSLAYAFAKDFMTPADAEDDGVPLLRPQTGGRRGPPPLLHQSPNLQAEAKFIASEFRAINKAGWPWRDMAVVYRSRFIGEKVTQCLRESGIPVEWLGEAKGRNRFSPGEDSVKVMTMHSSKGLEFPVVAIPGLGYAPPGEADPIEEARLLYVAMTRAMDVLLMTCHQESELVTRIKRARSQLAATKV